MKVPSACSWLALLSAAHAAIAAASHHDEKALDRRAAHARNFACAKENKCDSRVARRRANAAQARYTALESRDQRNNPDNVFDDQHWNRLNYNGWWDQVSWRREGAGHPARR